MVKEKLLGMMKEVTMDNSKMAKKMGNVVLWAF